MNWIGIYRLMIIAVYYELSGQVCYMSLFGYTIVYVTKGLKNVQRLTKSRL